MKPMYGVTHNMDGTARVQVPKTVKVGIGLPAGPSIYAYINGEKQWVVVVGKEGRAFPNKQEAQKFYRATKPNAPKREYPQRLPFFIFTRVSPDGTFEPEWDAIESCGPLPTEVDIVFVSDEPFTASYQMWTATERKCEGDGQDAMRICSMAATDEEKALAKQAEAKGEKYFPIKGGCWMHGCRFSKPPDERHPAPCRPHGRLLFQLFNAIRLGGTAYYDTTGFRSISQIYSCLETFKTVSGKGRPENGFVAGIPLKLVLRPYKVAHNGKSATQYGVALEFRASSAIELKKQLVEHAVQYRLAEAEPLKALNAAPTPIDLPPSEEDTEPPPETAAAMAAEFYPAQNQGTDDEDFADPEAAAETAPPIKMPRRKSEKAVQQPATQEFGAEPADEEPQLIDHLWADPSLGASMNPPPHPPVYPNEPPPPSSPHPEPKPATPIPQTQAAPQSNGNGRWKKLLNVSRAKGVPDNLLYNEMGRLGFEMASDITDKGYEELNKWVQDQKPKQASLT